MHSEPVDYFLGRSQAEKKIKTPLPHRLSKENKSESLLAFPKFETRKSEGL